MVANLKSLQLRSRVSFTVFLSHFRGSRNLTTERREARQQRASIMPPKARPPAGIGRSWVPVANQRVKLIRKGRENWEERAMTVTVTSVNKSKMTFNADGIGSGGAVVGRAFRLLKVCFSQIEALLDIVKRTRGIGSVAMIHKKKRRRKPSPAPAAAPAAPAPAPAPVATGAPAPTAVAATPTAAAKANFLRTELNVPGHYTIAQVTTEAERQLGLTPSPGDKVGQRLDKAYQELRP